MPDHELFWENAVAGLKAQGRFRRLRLSERSEGARIRFDGGPELIDFSSNDYLGLSHHPALIKGAQDYAERFGAGAGASRLLSGNLLPSEKIERKLAVGKRMEAALVFATGAQANLTLLPAILDARMLGAEPLVYADRLNHASLIQGCIGAGVRQIRFRHNDLNHLEELLKRDEGLSRPRFIITESVFSMDGDGPDFKKLSEVAKKYNAFLYIDEAHATGVLGENGFGLACGLKNALVMGTFSKGLGGFGAYAVCSDKLRKYLINRCGGLIYTTFLPPAVLGTMNAALDLIPFMDKQRAYLADLGSFLRLRLNAAGLDTGGSTTQIVPLVLGKEEAVLSLSARLEEEGFCAVAIRPPTVPAGTSRLRLALSVLHKKEDVAALAEAIIGNV